ncbi:MULTISPECIES: diacylglycerol kinase family protein [unclassified Paenibacillus]|uniref:Diacylglycerol kinase family protein n=1 Tax=Paenibacillus provencensis TaxID=441151 RepID=A0ABW3PQQ7_9BACL|nr:MULTISPECIES: diacylglycerol kinase family protein [unclassified Paenibacillus]MCM3126207.1 diacylglycerol kinase family protein [Paenibacillus sp. MER 78]SFS61570.1 diacylglycerol kinase (ATP) [Paenibacillus sp. 453mf]
MRQRSIVDVFRNAMEGLIYGFRTQRNLRVHAVLALVAVAAGWLLDISRTDWMFISLAIGFVIVTELLNTAIEIVVDLASPEIHPLAKAAKDTAAGAVLLAAVFAVIIGIFVYLKPFIRWIF